MTAFGKIKYYCPVCKKWYQFKDNRGCVAHRKKCLEEHAKKK